MKPSNNILIQTVSNALCQYAIANKLGFMYDNNPLTIEETFNEKGALILFLYEAKSMYESIYKETFVSSIIEYNEETSFPLGMIECKSESFFDYIPTLYTARNFENVLIFSIHALIQLSREHDTRLLPLDDLHERFYRIHQKH